MNLKLAGFAAAILAIVIFSGASVSPAQTGTGAGTTETQFSTPAFYGKSLINLPTTKCLDKGEVLFRVSHRFIQPSNSGYHSFYGLDGPAYILLSFGYGIRDDWSVTLGRTNFRDEVELSSVFSLFQQGGTHNLPLSAVLVGAATLTTQVPPGELVFVHKNVRLSIQAGISRQVTNRLSVLVVPSFASNTEYDVTEKQNTFGLGVGGRMLVLNNISLVGEIVPVMSGYKTDINTWGLGVEIKKGGHVFHFFMNDEYGLTPNQYLPGGDLKLADGNVRFGFNIYRSFWL